MIWKLFWLFWLALRSNNREYFFARPSIKFQRPEITLNRYWKWQNLILVKMQHPTLKLAVPLFADPPSKCSTPPKKCSTGSAKPQEIYSRHNLHFYTIISTLKKWGVLQEKNLCSHPTQSRNLPEKSNLVLDYH